MKLLWQRLKEPLPVKHTLWHVKSITKTRPIKLY